MNSPQVILLIACIVAAIVAVAESVHAKRIRRISRLAFGPAGPRAWTKGVPVVRVLAAGLVAWGGLTLLSLDGAPDEASRTKPPDRHLLLVLDVSPSMYITDAGATAKESRQHRAADIMQSVLDRIDLANTRVSVVAFYSTARPVVVDSFDIDVITNILRDLPLSHAFKEGQTNMYEGVRAAAGLAKAWKPGSATLVVVSDGDTLPDTGLPLLPPSIADTIVIGVGNPYRGTQIAERSSRQDAMSLKRLAARLQGVYHDGNAKHLPTEILGRLTMLGLKAGEQASLRTIALWAVGIGGTLLAMIAPLLAWLGVRGALARPGAARMNASVVVRAPEPGRSTAVNEGSNQGVLT